MSSQPAAATLDEIAANAWSDTEVDSFAGDMGRPAAPEPDALSGVVRSNPSFPPDPRTEAVPASAEWQELSLHETPEPSVPPENGLDEQFLEKLPGRGEIEQRESNPAGDTPPRPVSNDSGPGPTTREASVFESLRNRVIGKSKNQEPQQRAAPPGDIPLLEGRGKTREDRESDPLPVVAIGLEEASHGWPNKPRGFNVPLEAPTPLSSVTRQTVMVERLSQLPQKDTGETHDAQSGATAAAANEDGDGIVSSFIDVFDIRGHRKSERVKYAEELLRQSRLAELERPLARDKESDRSASADAFLTPMQTLHWQDEMDRLTTLLETQLASQTPGETPIEQEYYLRQQVALRLLYLIGSRRAEALQAIPHCEPSQQEFWTAMLWTLSNIFDEEAMPDRAQRAREAATQLRAALEQMAPQAGLELTHCQFCRQIGGFGSYETFERDEFSPGQAVLIYAQVQNFLSDATPDGRFLTVLQSTLTIRERTLNNTVVLHEALPPTEDRCRSRRSDYYHSYRVMLPQDLSPGPHVLSLTIRDELGQKHDTVSLNFMVRE